MKENIKVYSLYITKQKLHIFMCYWTLNLGKNWTLGAIGSGEGKSTPCQSNPQSRAVQGGAFCRRARWPAQTSSHPTWWTPSGWAPLPDTATPDTHALVVLAAWERERERGWGLVKNKREVVGSRRWCQKKSMERASGREADSCCISVQSWA